MRKLLTLAVVVSFLFGMFPTMLMPNNIAKAETENETAVFNLATFHQVGYDWDNKLMVPARQFPWQKVGQTNWGRTNFLMPNIIKAVNTNGVPIPVTAAANAVEPLYYSQVYLNITAQGGISQESNAYYVVMDNQGQVWFDPDGFFQDSRYDPTADPIPARWPFETYPLNNNYVAGSCSVNLNAKMDPNADNNTKGPYIFNKFHPQYQNNVYFWDYKKDEKSNASDRLWQLGWVDMVDYPFVGAVKWDGTISDGLVRYDIAKANGDWDYNMPLVPFYQVDPINPLNKIYQEFHTELTPEGVTSNNEVDGLYTPGAFTKNGANERPHEAIYRADLTLVRQLDDAGAYYFGHVMAGDMRLTAVPKKRGEETKLYPEGTIVQAGDWDEGDYFRSFNENEKHADNSFYNKMYDPNEWIYRIQDPVSTKVTAGDLRLTNVNGKRIPSYNRLSLESGVGLFTGDALMMYEVFEGGCHTDKYDLTVLTDLYMGKNPSEAAVALRTPNGDIAVSAQRVQKNTVLDPALDKERYHLLPGTTFHNVKFQYREYLGVQVFWDSAYDNNIGFNHPQDYLNAQDLDLNLVEERTGEQYVGAQDYSSVLDLGRILEKIPDTYKYHDTTGNGYGCGESIYWMSNPNKQVVEAGDKRFTDVDMVQNNVRIHYKRNTLVAPGDADENLNLTNFYYTDSDLQRHDVYKFYPLDTTSVTPDYSKPFDYDPYYTGIYHDKNENSTVDLGDVRLTDVTINETTYYCGSEVTGGNNWYMESPVHMISIGRNGDFTYADTAVLPGDIGLKVTVDGIEEDINKDVNNGVHSTKLRVEKTSEITVTVDPPPKEGEKVYITLQDNLANEFNVYRYHEWLFNRTYIQADYNFEGQPMNWYGDGGNSAGIWEYELPFEFPYMGRFYNRVFVSEKGFLNLTQMAGMPDSIAAADARIMVYGDDLSILPPNHPMNITTSTFDYEGRNVVNRDVENIYILKTDDSVIFRWRAQTRYETGPAYGWPSATYPSYLFGSTDYGSYRASNGRYYALVDVQATLFSDGTILMNFLKDVPSDADPINAQINKLYNQVNNVNRNTWVIGAPVIGITTGTSGSTSMYSSLKNLAIVDGIALNDIAIPNTWTYYINPRLSQYSAEQWKINITDFNKPTRARPTNEIGGSNYDDYDEWKPFEDFRVITADNPVATFQFTPYRGTSRDSGIPDWVEIRAYKDIEGSTVNPQDSTYTYIQNYNYSDPTIWDSKWTRPEYFKSPWGEYQKTKYFVYPPIDRLIPVELSNNYDCFGIARLEVDAANIEIIPDKECINPLDERQPMLGLTIKNFNDPDDVNDPSGMLMSSWRRTATLSGMDSQVDFGLTDSWYPPYYTNSPVGAYYLRIRDGGYINVFKVGDIVYIPGQASPSVGEYRRIVRIDLANRRIWFDMPLVNAHTPNCQVVPNPIIGNYNIKGGGIKGMFTTIGTFTNNPNGGAQRYIVQVRDDGSYDYWRWFEPLVIGQVVGALDAHDLLYSWQHCSQYDRFEGVNPPLNPPSIRTPFPFPNPRPPLGLEDMDCSIGQSMNEICGDGPEFPKLGDWNMGDRYGVFGNNADYGFYYPNVAATPPQAFGSIATWGVPVLITPYKTPVTSENLYDDGGKCVIATWPQDPATPINIRLYTNTAVFDYNSVYKHPPFFALEPGMGIDYCGEVSVKVGKPNADLNFTDMAIIDHSLQNSKVSYTLGSDAVSPLPPPTPQIASRYYPMARDFNRDLRAYPGGQDHTGRVEATIANYENPPGNNWNAYPAIWENKYVKLGTEFMPMSDYGLAFYVKTTTPYDHYSFYALGTQRIVRMTIEGPFAFPRTFMEDHTRGSALTGDQYIYKLSAGYEYNDYQNIPIDYDFSGKLVIDSSNANKFELRSGASQFYYNAFKAGALTHTGPLDFKKVTNPGFPFDAISIPDNEVNPWLYNDEKWFYWGVGRYDDDFGAYPNFGYCVNPVEQMYWMLNPVFLIDELIPVAHGDIKITILAANGIEYTYKECCEDPPLQSLPVHGIKISGAPKELEIDEDHTLDLTLTEGKIPIPNAGDQEGLEASEFCNSAVMVAWQDRGYLEMGTRQLVGMGDGQLANPPRSSNWYKKAYQFPEGFDLNADGKVSFADYETEILGAYDMATNTWSSGVVDGRTFMRENGEYSLDLSAANSSQITTIGYDFGGIPDEAGTFDKKQDHIISQYETIPIYINAYKYGDDNNDRANTPLWSPFAPNEHSHEVYLSGMTKIMPAPRNELVINYGPDPITAGVTPELVDPAKPLSFAVMDEQGNPVDLTMGLPDQHNIVKALDRNVWNILVQDPHLDNKDFFGMDAKLPQYYWVRTDLHNNDATLYDNESIYFSAMTPFDPIRIDFTKSNEGVYTFYNFCANDAGSFLVRFYTPDRRRYGETTVSVKLPSINYQIVNNEDPTKTVFEVPGSPDFIMTAMDRRVYTVSVQVFDAQGDILKGTAGASICEGTDDARITVTNTFLRNFQYRALSAPRYYNLIGVDKNLNGNIDLLNHERLYVDGFRGGWLYYTGSILTSGGWYSTTIIGDIPPENMQYDSGWGLGCIYNSIYKGGYCFPDINRDQILTFHDSISLDQEGRASFLYYANDMGLTESFLGCFIGKNRLTTNPAWNDVAGIPAFDAYGPTNVYYRFRYGGQRFFQNSLSMFRLDWDAHPDLFVSIKGPEFRFLEGRTRLPMSKELLEPSYYDLVYGVENHIIVQAYQADSRDLPLKENGRILFLGGRAEMNVEGQMKMGPDQVPETYIKMTPAGTGISLGTIRYILLKGGFGEYEDIDVGLNEYSHFDVALGLGIEVNPLGDLLPKNKVTLHIKVTDIATKKPIESAEVRIIGAGTNDKARSNSEGICTIDITPSEEGLLTITAEKEKMIKGITTLYVGKDKREIFLHMDTVPTITNQKQLQLSGVTKPNLTVLVNDTETQSDKTGRFTLMITLQEGKNTIRIQIKEEDKVKEEILEIVVDSLAPKLTFDEIGQQVDITSVTLRGTVNEDSVISCGEKTAVQKNQSWELTLPVVLGKNVFSFHVLDHAGNEATVSHEIYVYRKRVIELQIGSKTVYKDGLPVQTLPVPPYIKQARTMVPLRMIAESFGAEVAYQTTTKGITIRYQNKEIRLVVGTKQVNVNQEVMTLEVAPEIVQSVTFVPLRFITEALGLEVEWVESTRTVKVVDLI
ncbi:copper amine oxidase N-terminal domain-containing protein [bacterium]|nr:copper amine oxidase N-terminal domain-containing protein [bacterium]